jgi:hypothetical protein
MFPEVKSDLLLALAPASYRCDNDASLSSIVSISDGRQCEQYLFLLEISFDTAACEGTAD